MTCKDCIHYDVCKRIDDKMELKNMSLNEAVREMCRDFKDKSKNVELPCKVGDTVYIIEPFNGICDMTLRNARVNDVLKNNIFLTRSEAERKLKEINNEH